MYRYFASGEHSRNFHVWDIPFVEKKQSPQTGTGLTGYTVLGTQGLLEVHLRVDLLPSPIIHPARHQ